MDANMKGAVGSPDALPPRQTIRHPSDKNAEDNSDDGRDTLTQEGARGGISRSKYTPVRMIE